MRARDRLYLRRSTHWKAYACVHVLDGHRPVLLVSRADDDWVYLCGGEHDSFPDDEWLLVVGMGHVLAADPSLIELRTLPPEVQAERACVGAPWTVTCEDE